ncbi:hypothetical protein HK099_007131 [Clydaea vesicula]|uniref:C2H2-type domain-containing protein n=1 Tax=Clydaea vesicula TaxID=447962 RepID=A0AAD5TWR0_9FUNG|nr:hypothetical protein HK099_007131 [Clydaea vesicula]
MKIIGPSCTHSSQKQNKREQFNTAANNSVLGCKNCLKHNTQYSLGSKELKTDTDTVQITDSFKITKNSIQSRNINSLQKKEDFLNFIPIKHNDKDNNLNFSNTANKVNDNFSIVNHLDFQKFNTYSENMLFKENNNVISLDDLKIEENEVDQEEREGKIKLNKNSNVFSTYYDDFRKRSANKNSIKNENRRKRDAVTEELSSAYLNIKSDYDNDMTDSEDSDTVLEDNSKKKIKSDAAKLKVFRCSFPKCVKSFKKIESLKTHATIHNKENRYALFAIPPLEEIQIWPDITDVFMALVGK